MTVEGSTIKSARRHLGQNRRNIIQKSLSVGPRRGLGFFWARIASCCRSAKFSSKRSRRERKILLKLAVITRNIRSIRLRLRERLPVAYSPDFKDDRYFGETQGIGRKSRLICSRILVNCTAAAADRKSSNLSCSCQKILHEFAVEVLTVEVVVDCVE
jgi:hypothetical protein